MASHEVSGKRREITHDILVAALRYTAADDQLQLRSPHIDGQRISELGEGDIAPTDREANHLTECLLCDAKLIASHEKSVRLRPRPIPAPLLNAVRVKGECVAFPDGTFSDVSFQFGRLQRLSAAKLKGVVSMIAEKLAAQLQLEFPFRKTETLLFAAFGEVMHMCAVEAARLLTLQGFSHVSAVLVTDIESPKFSCNRDTFVGARIVCLCDVAHRGKLLEKMAKEAASITPDEYVHRTAVIKKFTGKQDAAWGDHTGLWHWRYEEREPVSKFKKSGLKVFDGECGMALENGNVSRSGKMLSDLLLHRRALSVNTRIDSDCYLFSIDCAKLIEPRTDPTLPGLPVDNALARAERILELKIWRLLKESVGKDPSRKTVFVYSQRDRVYGASGSYPECRPRSIARTFGHYAEKLLGRWIPRIGVGWRVGSFEQFTQQQAAELKKFDQILLVDSAVRTGDSFRSLYTMVREIVGQYVDISGLAVIGPRAELTMSCDGMDRSLKIKSVLSLPLLPPVPKLDALTGQIAKAIARHESSLPKKISILMEDYGEAARRQLEKRDNSTYWGRRQNFIEGQMLARPYIAEWALWALGRQNLGVIEREQAILVLAIMGNFEWMMDPRWIQNYSGEFDRTTQRGHWRAVPGATVFLLDECLAGRIKRTKGEGLLRSLIENLRGYSTRKIAKSHSDRAQLSLFAEIDFEKELRNEVSFSVFDVIRQTAEWCLESLQNSTSAHRPE